ncbi:MAG: hypothetical protein HQ461_13050 [Deltaproteobacteria bacterium]|nr:hypothetical protein [Deltaproteobacteria bacterium]
MDYETLKRDFEQNPAFAQTATAPAQPPATSALREAARVRAASEGPTGVAAVLHLVGALGIIAGGVIFAGADTSIHEIAAVLIVIGGLVSFTAGALLTELQRIKTVLLMGLPPVE